MSSLDWSCLMLFVLLNLDLFIFLPELVKFSTVMFSNKYVLCLFFPPFLGPSLIQMLVCLMFSQWSLNLSSFLFSIQLQSFLLLWLLACWSSSLYHLIYYWFLLVYLSLLHPSSLFNSSFYFLFVSNLQVFQVSNKKIKITFDVKNWRIKQKNKRGLCPNWKFPL